MGIYLQVDNFLVRRLQREDGPALFTAISENKQHLRSGIHWVDQIKRPLDADEIIREAHLQESRQKALAAGIFQGAELIGFVEMQDWNHLLKKARIGYWVIQREEGKGVMSRCLNAFLAFLFEQLKLNKVELLHLPENHRSAALAKRLGFQVEGILRDQVWVNGVLAPVVFQGLLRREFLNRP